MQMEESQLVMIRKHLDEIPEVPLPPGYDIRYFLDGDEERLQPVFCQCFDPGWSRDRVVKTFVEDPIWSPNRMCVLTYEGHVVGTASAWEDRTRPNHGVVHYVAVMPKHRGKRLGIALVARVLTLLKSLGYPDAWLRTDDFRLPAIRTYLALGFEPVAVDKSHSERWEIIRHKLNASDAE